MKASVGLPAQAPGIRSLSRDIPIKFLVVAGFLLAGLLPVIVVSLLSLSSGKEALRDRALQQLESVRSLKRAQLDRFFLQRQRDAATLASDPYVREALTATCGAFRDLGGAAAGQLKGLNHRRFQAPPAYIQVHDRYLPYLQGFVDRHDYYDLFLLDGGAGEICYTVEKESDFGVRVAQWPTSLRDVWQEVVAGAPFALSDTKLYAPSANAAAQFVAAPVRDPAGRLLGVVALQIGLEGIDEILGDRAGMGTTGESYLVGPDLRMRSDASLDPKGHSVTASFTNPVAQSGMDTQPVRRALDGETGTMVAPNYRQKPALAAFAPLGVGKVTWALVAQIEDAEIEAQIDAAFNRQILLVLGLSILLVLVLGLLVSAFIILAIRQVTREVGRLSGQVLEGDLSTQGNPSELGTDFRDVVHSLNGLLGSFVVHLDLLPAPLVLVDSQGRLRFANLAMCQLLGAPRAQLLGRQYPELCATPQPAVLQALATGTVIHQDTIWEVAGQQRNYFSTAAPFTHLDGPPLGAMEVLVDQTDARRMEQENAALEEQISRIHRLDSLGTLASGIAHDFNNILGYLFAYADIAKGMLPPESPAQTPLASLAEGIQRASDLVQQILTFSRQARGQSQEVDLASVVQATLDIAKAALPAGLDLQCDLEAGCLVQADPGQLQQVVLNLFTNAWQATAKGGWVRVVVGAADQGWVRLVVADSGVGIPEDLHARIFEPFFSTKATGEGTGLGLSVVHGIVRRLGGQVTVRSAPCQGATFEVLLPAAEAHPRA
jgi:methyl-accepting chemotaxis protein